MTQQKTTRTRGRRPTLSLEIILNQTIEILDAAGASALTFRTLAAELDTGVGSIYHYIKNRDELLDGATNRVLEDTLAELNPASTPEDSIRHIGVALFDILQAHPWASSYLMRDFATQSNSMRVFEALGQQLMRMELAPADCFNAAGTLWSFIIGSGADIVQLPAEKLIENKTQNEFLREYAEQWRALDVEAFPFLRTVAADFAEHDDREQFIAGLDIILRGIASSY